VRGMTEGSMSQRPARVLVIDDDRDIRFVIRMNLEAEGFEVIECADGFSAVEAAATTMPDIMVCDIMMPGLDGFGVLTYLRENPETARIPVVFLTARGSDQEIWDGWQAGADYYLTKPFDPDELIAFVRYVLGQNQSVGPWSSAT
jgi:DNA-binding response OmpR family regulator